MRRTQRGSTVIEVLMAISILAVGASGIIAMQKVAVVANKNAKNLEIANSIAKTWVERLQADAMLWNHPSMLDPTSDIDTDTRWLKGNVKDSGAMIWFRPTDSALNIYGVHDAFGRDDTSGNLTGPFCVSLRLSWLRASQDLVRAEVRVHWMRDNVQAAANVDPSIVDDLPSPHFCSPPDGDLGHLLHFVHVVTALRKNQAH